MVLKHACRLGLEGIVSKLANAPYRSGRTKAWLKSKCVDSDEFVIIGYVPSTTQRRTVGSLVARLLRQGQARLCGPRGLGLLDRGGRGSVAPAGSDPRRGAARSPRRRRPKLRRNVRWAKPSLVAEVELRGWTADGIVRHAVFKGLRQDKQAADVAPEKPAMRKPRARKTPLRFPSPSPIPTACCGRTSA